MSPPVPVRRVQESGRGPRSPALPPPNVIARVLNEYIPDILCAIDDGVIGGIYGADPVPYTRNTYHVLANGEDRGISHALLDIKNYVKQRVMDVTATQQ